MPDAQKTLQLKLLFDNKGALKAVETTGKKFNQLNKNLEKTKQGIDQSTFSFRNMLKVGLAFAGVSSAINIVKNVVISAIKTYRDFEQSIANVQSVSGGTRDELMKLARAAGATTVFSAKEAADAMYLLASAGLKVDEMAKVLNPTLNLASATQIGIAEATDIVVSSLKVFQANMDEAGKFTDVMAQTVRSANTNMTQLGEALVAASPLAKQAGISFEDLNVIIASMANLGIKGGTAGTQLRMAFARLIKPPKEAAKALESYNIKVAEIQGLLKNPIKLFKRLSEQNISNADALKIFGVRQTGVALLIKDGIKDLGDMSKALEKSGGAAQKMAKIQLNTLQGALKLLNSAWQELIITVMGGGGVSDALKNLVQILRAVVIALADVGNAGVEIDKTKNSMEKLAKEAEATEKKMNKIRAVATAVFGGISLVIIQAFLSWKTFFNAILTSTKLLIIPFRNLGRAISDTFSGNFKSAKLYFSKTTADIKKVSLKFAKTTADDWKGFGKRTVNIWKSITEEIKKELLKQNKNTKKSLKTRQEIIEKELAEKEIEFLKDLEKAELKTTIVRLKYIEDLLKKGNLSAKQRTLVEKEQTKLRKEIDKKYNEFVLSDRENKIQKIKDKSKELLDEQKTLYDQGLISESTYNQKRVAINEQAAQNINKVQRGFTQEQPQAFDAIATSIKKLASIIGGQFAQIVSDAVDLVKALASGDPWQTLVAAVSFAVNFVIAEINKMNVAREMMKQLEMQRLSEIELAGANERVRILEGEHAKQNALLQRRHDAELQAFEQSSAIAQQNQAVLDQIEAEKIAAMDETEKKRYLIQKKYDDERQALIDKQEDEKKAQEKRQKQERNEAKRKQFEANQAVQIAQARIDREGAIAKIHKEFWAPWDYNTRRSLISGTRSLYSDIISAISSQKFIPEYQEGSEFVPSTQLATLHGGERVLTASQNRALPNLANSEIVNRVLQTTGANQNYNTYNNQRSLSSMYSFSGANFNIPAVDNPRALLMELEKVANSMDSTMLSRR